MGTTVSRRVIFVKSKNKRVPPKPKPAPRDDDEVVGEAARPSAPLRAMPPAQPAPGFRPSGMLVGASLGGLLAIGGIVAAAISYLSGLPNNNTERHVTAAPSIVSAPAHGNRRSHTGGYPGASGGGGVTSSPISVEQGFLNAPFRKRKPARAGCSVQAEYSQENMADLRKCLEQRE